MPVRAVVFDLFDTLVDLPMDALPRIAVGGREIPSTLGALHEAFCARAPVELESFARALAAIDREWRATHWECDRELPTPVRFARLGRALGVEDPELPDLLTGVHMGMLEQLARTPAHHAALLARLHERLRLGLCSNWSWSPTGLDILERARLRETLDAIVFSHDHGLRKPRREIFEAVVDQLGVRPEETVHVGDNLAADVAGAAQLGIRTVWVTRRVPDPDAALARHAGPRPDWTVCDLAELEAILPG